MKKTVTLSVTHSCNLNCCYCYECGKDSSMIDAETGKEIIRKEIAAKDGFDEIDFSFFGGEPFLNFPVIRELYEYAHRLSDPSKKISFSAITNGTKLSEEMKQWLAERASDFIVTLSLDGTKQMHDRNRNGSFDCIDTDFFLRTYSPAYVKMTVSQYTLASLAEGVIYLTESGFRIACNLAYGIDWTEENLNTLEIELEKLVQYYLQHPEAEICSMLEFPYREIFHTNNTGKIFSCCSAKRESVAYDLDGAKYPCHMFFPINGKKPENVDALPFSETGELNPELLDEKCRTCPVISVCQQCYGSNYLLSGNIFHVAEDVCTINKITFRAKAKLAAELWKNGQLRMDETEEAALLRSLLLVSEL